MLVSETEFEGYVANSTPEISEMLLNSLNKNIIIADWQYGRYHENWKTSEKFKNYGFNTVCCPWDNKDNIDSAIRTVKEYCLFGIIHTTWHSLFKGFSEMVYAGVVSYGAENKNLSDIRSFYCAHLARMAMTSNGEYEKCGWSEKMTGPGLV